MQNRGFELYTRHPLARSFSFHFISSLFYLFLPRSLEGWDGLGEFSFRVRRMKVHTYAHTCTKARGRERDREEGGGTGAFFLFFLLSCTLSRTFSGYSYMQRDVWFDLMGHLIALLSRARQSMSKCAMCYSSFISISISHTS